VAAAHLGGGGDGGGVAEQQRAGNQGKRSLHGHLTPIGGLWPTRPQAGATSVTWFGSGGDSRSWATRWRRGRRTAPPGASSRQSPGLSRPAPRGRCRTELELLDRTREEPRLQRHAAAAGGRGRASPEPRRPSLYTGDALAGCSRGVGAPSLQISWRWEPGGPPPGRATCAALA
jgi:hypothetical protein